MLDTTADLFTITDLKQYIYCPRVFYYHSCLPDIRPTTYKMEAGIQAHTTEPKRAIRRSAGHIEGTLVERHFDVWLQSATLGLSAKIDEVIQTSAGWFPVDYKLSRKAGYHFKVQLAAYALLVEESKTTRVKSGYLYLIPLRKVVEVPVTAKLRRTVRQALAAMRHIAATEAMPPPTDWRQRCVDCEFRRFCNDV